MHDIVDDDKPAVYAHMPKWNLYLFRFEKGNYKCQNGYNVICLLSKSPSHFTRVIDAHSAPHSILDLFLFLAAFARNLQATKVERMHSFKSATKRELFGRKSERWGTASDWRTHDPKSVFVLWPECSAHSLRVEWRKIMWRVHFSSSRTKQR